jgi:Mg-chelatase subunit ChlD
MIGLVDTRWAAMGRKPKKGLREAILAEASEQPTSATMIRDALEARYGAEPTTLTGVIKAAEGLRTAGMLRASQAMPEVYHGARTRTYYRTTPKGMASLKDAIASAIAGWNGCPADDAAKAAESTTHGKARKKKRSTAKGDDAESNDGRKASQQLLVAMIIDKSGSMSNLTKDTVGGFNEYLADRQQETPQALMSVTLFDTERDDLHVAKVVTEIPKLTEERYRRGGMGYTALNDAIGGTIAAIDAGNYAKERNVLVVVMTDGLENASKEWKSRAEIADLVKRKENDGWKVVFFGANIDAFAEGATMNIPQTRSVQYMPSPEGTADSYRKMSRATSLLAHGAAEETWIKELSETSE